MLDHDTTAMPPQPALLPVSLNTSSPRPRSSPQPDSLEPDSPLPHDTISPSLLAEIDPDLDADAMFLSLSPSDSDTSKPASALLLRERQRQLSQKKSIEALVGDMIATGTQCSVADAPLIPTSTSMGLSYQSMSELIPAYQSASSLPYSHQSASESAPSHQSTSEPPPWSYEPTSSHQPAATTIPPPSPITIDLDLLTPDAPLAVDDDEGFQDFDPDADGDDIHPSLFAGQYARADDSCDVRRRFTRLKTTLGFRRAAGQEGVATMGAGMVRARVRKRIGRTKRVEGR